MKVTEALNCRHTVRAFKPQQLDRKKIISIIAAASRSPSWANSQPWEIYLAGGAPLEELRSEFLQNLRNNVPLNPDLSRPQQWPAPLERRMKQSAADRYRALGIERGDDEARQAMIELGFRFFDAPLVAYLCLEHTLTAWSIFDLGLLAQSIMLAAQEHGVESAPAFTLVGYPDLIRKHFDIPADLSIIIGLALGYSDTEHPQNRFRSSRRPLEEFVHFAGI